MRTVAILNLKGGVGKTITAVNMAAILATEHDKRVLLVDADSQGDSTKTLLRKDSYHTLADLMLKRRNCYKYYDVIYHSIHRNLDILPSDFSLATVGMPGVEDGVYYKEALQNLRDNVTENDDYDFILIDCPSSFGHPGCQAAIRAAGSVVVPTKTDANSIAGVQELVPQIAALRTLNPILRIDGCLVTAYCNTEYDKSAVKQFRADMPVPVYRTLIRNTPRAAPCTATHEVLIHFSPNSAAAVDYRRFVMEYLNREEALR